MHRYELTDAEWERIAPCFPDRTHHGGAGHHWNDHRPLVNGILWRLHTGAPWPDVPARYGPWQTVYDRFNRWRKDGTWATILDALLLRLDTRGCIDRDLWMVDGSVVRATRAAAGAKKKIPDQWPRLDGPEALQLQEPADHALGRSRGGFGTKVHLVCDGHGIVLAIGSRRANGMTPKCSRSLCCGPSGPVTPVRGVGRTAWPEIRGTATTASAGGLAATISGRSSRPARISHRTRRSTAGRTAGGAGSSRSWALGTRYEKLAVNYVALWLIAVIEKLAHKYTNKPTMGLTERA